MSTVQVDQLGAGDNGSPAYTLGGVAKVRLRYNQRVPQTDESENIASVTDNATGSYTANFTNSMSSVYHSISAMSVYAGVVALISAGPDGTASASSANVLTRDDTDVADDADRACFSTQGDLA